MNKVFLIGRITQDLELKQTPNWKSVISFWLATNYRVKNWDEYEQKTDFHNMVAWNKTAELIAQYLNKWSLISFIWKLQTREWEGQDGIKRYRTEILVEDMEFIEWNKNTEPKAVASSNKKSPTKPTKKSGQSYNDEEIDIDNIPF